MLESRQRLLVRNASLVQFKTGNFIIQSLPTTGVWRSDTIRRHYDLPKDPVDHIGPSSVENTLGDPRIEHPIVVLQGKFTNKGFGEFTYDVNFPDIFLAYKGYWVSLLVDFDAVGHGRAFRDAGNSLTVDVSSLMEGAVTKGLTLLDVDPDLITASIEVIGRITGKGRLRVQVNTNIQDIPYREGSGFAVGLNLLAIILYNDITRVRGVRRPCVSETGSTLSGEWETLGQLQE